MYSEIVMDHFRNPRNVGKMENPDGIGEVGNPQCGDMMTMYIKVKDDKIADISFQTFGCGAAVAVSSMITEMAKGKSVDEAARITNKDVAKNLGGLPQKKLHCSNLGADALRLAIQDYRKKQSGGKPATGAGHGSFIHLEQPPVGESACECPYCEAVIDQPAPYCKACGADLAKDREAEKGAD
jgi:nitrogen fixation NifU-like protein